MTRLHPLVVPVTAVALATTSPAVAAAARGPVTFPAARTAAGESAVLPALQRVDADDPRATVARAAGIPAHAVPPPVWEAASPRAAAPAAGRPAAAPMATGAERIPEARGPP